MKESFVFYETWAEAIKQIPDKERLQIYDAIMAYGVYGEKTDIGGLAQMALNLVYNDIDACKTKRAERAEKNRENIRNRWNKKDTIVYDCIQPIPTDTKDTVNVNVNGDVNVNDSIDSRECVEKSTPHTNTAKSIKEREADFMQEVAEIGKGVYPDTMLRAFFYYWTEKNTNGRKMRFEKEKVFDVKRRLATWASRENDSKFKTNSYGDNRNNPSSADYVPTERIVAAGFAMANAKR